TAQPVLPVKWHGSPAPTAFPPTCTSAPTHSGMVAPLLFELTQSTANAVVRPLRLLHDPSGLFVNGAQYGVLVQAALPNFRQPSSIAWRTADVELPVPQSTEPLVLPVPKRISVH